MRKFKDSKGREWNIAVTYGLCRRLKSELQERSIDLLEPLLPRGVGAKMPDAEKTAMSRPSLFSELQTDIVLFYEVLEAVVSPQLKAAGVDSDGDDGFGCAMAGDHLFAAQSAFFDEWRDFFQSLHRPEIVTAMEKSQKWWTKATVAMQEKMNNARLDETMERKLAEATSSGFGKLLESLDLTQSTAPFGS